MDYDLEEGSLNAYHSADSIRLEMSWLEWSRLIDIQLSNEKVCNEYNSRTIRDLMFPILMCHRS